MYKYASIQWIDPKSGFILHELYLDDYVESEDFKSFVNSIGGHNSAGRTFFERDKLLQIPILIDNVCQWPYSKLCLAVNLSNLPYRVHGGREFDLMKKKLKPLAVFRNLHRDAKEIYFIETYFLPETQLKKFVIDIFHEDPKYTELTTYAISLPHEYLRVQLYKTLINCQKLSKWSDGLEFIEGTLLGYNEEQNKTWLKNLNDRGNRWGLHLMYAFVEDSDKEIIFNNGFKCFPSTRREALELFLPYGLEEEKTYLKRFQ